MEKNLRTDYNFFPKHAVKLTNLNNLSTRNYYLIPPADPLIDRKNIPLIPPKFGKNFSIINLSPFINYKNEFEEEFRLEKKEKINIPIQEYILDLYINSHKMIKKLVYLKENFTNEGKVTIENFVNLIEYEREKKKNKYKNKEIQTKDLIKNNGFELEETLIFESKFESGNLQLVYLTEKSTDEENEEKIDKYQLFLHNDTNTTGYTQWFFFRVKNMKKGKTINFSIMNLLRKTTKYSYGIKIWVYSKKKNQIEKISWHHTKEKVKYYKNNLYRLKKGNRKYYYTLSFNYTFEYDNDEIFFANCIPFTYTDLMKDLNYYTKYENNKYPFYHRKTLCQTIGGNDVDYITINNSNINNMNKNNNKKKGIILIARQHPSETVSSFKIKGAIDFLMGESDEAKYLRDNYIFKIIPMINVDGVISGNTRTSFSGCDLNRRWINPDEYLHPEIYYTKDLIYNFSKKYNIECIIDFHGHFGAFNSFFYGNYDKDKFSYCKFFPFLCDKINDIITFDKSKFKMPKYKKGTGRIHLFKELNIENIFTLETSLFGCVNGKYTNQYITIEKLKNIGRDICIGILYLFYHKNLKDGIKCLGNYPKIKDKVIKKYNEIKKDFDDYVEIKEKEKLNNLNNENEENDSKKNENSDYDSLSENESNSESEPSGDNLNIEEIKNLIPFPLNKKRSKKKRKTAKQPLYLLNKKKKIFGDLNLSGDNNISNFQNFRNSKNINGINLPKVNNPSSDSKRIITSNSNRKYLFSANYKKRLFDISINNQINKDNFPNKINNKINNNRTINHNENIKSENEDNNDNNKNNSNSEEVEMLDSETQTEQIFFKMHWTHFIGMYTILTPKVHNNLYFQSSISDFVFEKFGNGFFSQTGKYFYNNNTNKFKGKNRLSTAISKKSFSNNKINIKNIDKKPINNLFKDNSFKKKPQLNNLQMNRPLQIVSFLSSNNIPSFDNNNKY